ncbi:MAG TPA: glycosyltransferase [Saprospiraceae bacterium]|nr:glycosyltransferase [Saprospiraceae bacterium]
MDRQFTHYLITRYNVPLEGWHVDRSGISTRDVTWLRHRQLLFEAYCVPTIRAQSEKNFTWLIYCDKETPESHLAAINKVVAPITQAKVRLVGDYFECMSDIDQQLTSSETLFVITSRVDNDDGLGIHYIKTIQSHFMAEDKLIINLLHGNGYNVPKQVATILKNIRNNHFGTLIEFRNSNGGHISVRGFQHGNPPSNFRVVNVQESNSWIKIFHERNLKSSAFGYPLLDPNLNQLFGIDKIHMPIHHLNTIIYFFWWLQDGIRRKAFSTKKKNKK